MLSCVAWEPIGLFDRQRCERACLSAVASMVAIARAGEVAGAWKPAWKERPLVIMVSMGTCATCTACLDASRRRCKMQRGGQRGRLVRPHLNSDTHVTVVPMYSAVCAKINTLLYYS